MLTLIALLAIQAEETGSLTVVNATPGATVHVLRLPAEVKDPASFAKLWSENDPVILEALAALTDELAKLAPGRVRDLARIGSPQVQALAKPKADKLGQALEPRPVVHRIIADIDGLARFPKVAPGVYHVYSTRPTSVDFHRQDVKIAGKAEITIDAAGRPANPDALPSGVEHAKVRVSRGEKVLGEVTLAPGKAAEVDGLRLELVDPLAEAEKLGTVKLVHRLYGVFVKLDPGFAAGPGEEIVIVRDGKEVARSTIVRVASADETYPDGAIQLSRDKIEVKKGDEIRRVQK